MALGYTWHECLRDLIDNLIKGAASNRWLQLTFNIYVMAKKILIDMVGWRPIFLAFMSDNFNE